MSIRELLASGELLKNQDVKLPLSKMPSVQELIESYWDEQDLDACENFLTKDTGKAERLHRSLKARTQRKQLKEIKQNSKKALESKSKLANKRLH